MCVFLVGELCIRETDEVRRVVVAILEELGFHFRLRDSTQRIYTTRRYMRGVSLKCSGAIVIGCSFSFTVEGWSDKADSISLDRAGATAESCP